MTDVDQLIARSTELIDRTRERAESQRRLRRRNTGIARRAGLIVSADLAIVIAAIVVGWIMPLGMGGALLVGALLVAVTLLLAFISLEAPVTPEKLVEVPLKALPLRTEQWLETQRPALPAPMQTLLDGIGVRLETLAPQLATLNEQEPAAAEVRKLVGEQLPELLKGYARVPEPLRGVERNGKTPDAQLAEGLQLIDREISEMSAQLAQGDLDSLATRGRFLEIKYRDDDAIGGKLDTIAPQLASLDEAEPAAAEIRKLIGEQLPELLKGYAKVPEPLRRVARNGTTPDQQLVDSLQLIDSEIAEMSAQLAQGDLDSLATRGRYLQIKYRDDEVGGS